MLAKHAYKHIYLCLNLYVCINNLDKTFPIFPSAILHINDVNINFRSSSFSTAKIKVYCLLLSFVFIQGKYTQLD